jgi:DNA-directed RNA polymerase specialized sigma24 family protein
MRQVSQQPNITAHQSLFQTLQRIRPALFLNIDPSVQIDPIPVVSLQDKLLFAVSKLPEPERHIMLMRVVGALSVDDIAAKLSTSRDNILDTLRAARANVKRYLELCG